MEAKEDGMQGSWKSGPANRQETKGELRKHVRTPSMVLESEEWLFATLRSIGDAVIVTDKDGRVVFMNPVAEMLTGWNERDALGMDCHDVFRIVSEDTREISESPVTKVIRDGVISGLANHTILIARDGSERSIDDSGSPVLNQWGELTGVVLIFRDVTEKRSSETTIREQRDILQLLFDHIPILVAFMDEMGHFRWVNRELERVLGWPLGELQARHQSPKSYTDLIHRQRAGQFSNWVSPGWHDFKTTTSTGEDIDISWASVPLSDGTVIGIGQVITDRIRDNHLAAEKMAMLQKMNDRFKVTIAETHHRVKNNLQTLSALVDLQSLANESSGDEQGLSHLKLHIRSLSTIHDLLARDTRSEAFTERVSAKEALEELLPLLRETINAEEITSSLDEVMLPVKMSMSLAIVVNELVTNAVKHGGRKIDLGLHAGPEAIRLEVSDDGRGFPPGFDPERSAHIGWELIERISRWDLQGETSYKNLPEGGACVTVSFPSTFRSASALAESRTV
jgi:PAS domain S-box